MQYQFADAVSPQPISICAGAKQTELIALLHQSSNVRGLSQRPFSVDPAGMVSIDDDLPTSSGEAVQLSHAMMSHASHIKANLLILLLNFCVQCSQQHGSSSLHLPQHCELSSDCKLPERSIDSDSCLVLQTHLEHSNISPGQHPSTALHRLIAKTIPQRKT